MMKWLALLMGVLAIVPQVAAQSPDQQLPAPQFIVSPGRSAGPAVLGMKVNVLEAALGHPTKVEDDGGRRWYTWRSPAPGFAYRDQVPGSLAVETAQNTVILISIAHDPRYRTRDGLGDGNSVDEVERMLGHPSSVMQVAEFGLFQYRTKGIAFVVDGSRHVTGIIIAPPVMSSRSSGL